MDALSAGTDDIVADSGQTVGAATSQSVAVPTYTNQTVTYYEISNDFFHTEQYVIIIKKFKQNFIFAITQLLHAVLDLQSSTALLALYTCLY